MRLLVVVAMMAAAACGSTAPAASTAATATPVSASADDALVRRNLDGVNAFRAQAGLPPYVLDEALTAEATTGMKEFAAGGPAHGHIHAHADDMRAHVHANLLFENQGKRGGSSGTDPARQIDAILQHMMDEGPGGGHHDAIVNPKLRRIGIAVLVEDNMVWLTNDFAD